MNRSFVAVLLLCASAAVAQAAPLDFDATFDPSGEPATLHYEATYSLQGATHRLDVWREGSSRLVRRTDDVIETHVLRSEGGDWRMVVLDLRRRVRTDVDRTHLFRIGQVVDWFGLAHGLSRPSGPYLLADADPPLHAGIPSAPCRWFSLTHDGETSAICWSSALRLPMLIAGPDGAVQWRVTHVDTQAMAADILRIDDEGFVRNDANEDIQGD